jgi:predicted ribosome quality control (RQC) complex YloA/Tae2 family protein
MITVGRNARENEELTLSMSGKDYWFHAYGVPGAHVILKGTPEPSHEDITEAARQAAIRSKAPVPATGPIKVIMARGTDVEKIKGTPIGTVSCEKYEIIKVSL